MVWRTYLKKLGKCVILAVFVQLRHCFDYWYIGCVVHPSVAHQLVDKDRQRKRQK